MGGGTDVALAAAEVNLLGGRSRPWPTRSSWPVGPTAIIAQNLFWAFAYNVVMIPLAVFGVLDPDVGCGRDGRLERHGGAERFALAALRAGS